MARGGWTGRICGTVSGIRTRRYHALLLVAGRASSGRIVLVNGIDAWLETPSGRFALSSQIDGARVTWRPYEGLPAISIEANGAYRHEPLWYRNFLYEAERECGLDHVEDLASPGSFDFELGAADAVVNLRGGEITACAAFDHGRHARGQFEGEAARRALFGSALERAASAYVVQRGQAKTVIAGYPWFTECHRRLRRARRAFGAAASGRRTLLSTVERILEAYRAGTRFGIRMDEDGLLAAGVSGLQLTWMDAEVGDRPVTPRVGKPVEVEALWLNALMIGGSFSPMWRELYAHAAASFRARFWNEERGCLFTVWPWLIGPFVEAWLRVRGESAAARLEADRRFLAPLREHLSVAGLGQVSEVADAEPPYTPGGCPFQAWSLGEFLRATRLVFGALPDAGCGSQ